MIDLEKLKVVKMACENFLYSFKDNNTSRNVIDLNLLKWSLEQIECSE